MVTRPKRPDSLGKRGAAFFTRIEKDIELEEWERQLLTEAARTLDEIDALKDSLDSLGVTVKGSMGQVVANPVLGELRQARAMFAKLVHQLDLPVDDEESVPRTAAERAITEDAKNAANVRWGMVKGRKATSG